MYDIISGIMDHVWNTQYSGDQQYIYFIAGAILIISFTCMLDVIRSVFHKFIR